jgi:hypothetical protein
LPRLLSTSNRGGAWTFGTLAHIRPRLDVHLHIAFAVLAVIKLHGENAR